MIELYKCIIGMVVLYNPYFSGLIACWSILFKNVWHILMHFGNRVNTIEDHYSLKTANHCTIDRII